MPTGAAAWPREDLAYAVCTERGEVWSRERPGVAAACPLPTELLCWGPACERLTSQSLCAHPGSPECGVGAEIHAGGGLVALGGVFAGPKRVWCVVNVC